VNPVVRLAEISETPLDVMAVVAALDDPSSGGLALFVGRVRDHDHGRAVARLGYEAHSSATERLREVCAEVAAEFGVSVAAVHRVGELEVGDLAVVAAASAGHRGDAYAASRALIDRIKTGVPIWKHQSFVEGDEEWVGLDDGPGSQTPLGER
jgi:molybdopterin synthase catalytic subunit